MARVLEQLYKAGAIEQNDHHHEHRAGKQLADAQQPDGVDLVMGCLLYTSLATSSGWGMATLLPNDVAAASSRLKTSSLKDCLLYTSRCV